MKSESIKAPRPKVTQVYVQTPRLRPTISYPRVKVLKQEPKLVVVRVRTPKENTDANSKNKGTQVKGRSVKP